MPSDTAVSLFSQTGIRQGLPSRIKDLLDVPIAPKDCLPEHICRKCKQKLECLERAAEELEDFRKEASSTYLTLALRQKELKRTEETSSSTGVSPDILRSRPPSKKRLPPRHLEFETGKITYK